MLALRHATEPLKWAGLGDHMEQATLPEEHLNALIPMVVALDLGHPLIALMRVFNCSGAWGSKCNKWLGSSYLLLSVRRGRQASKSSRLSFEEPGDAVERG
jgi:hypothetical protein